MKLLVFAHTPPPHHGQSYMVQLMLGGLGGDHHADPAAPAIHDVECYHVNARVSKRLEDIGEIHGMKLVFLLGHCLKAIWFRFRHGVTNFYYVPAPGKYSALYRDWIVMFLCRPFFRHVIFHWHAAGLGHWLETNVQRRSRAVAFHFLKYADVSVVLSEFNRVDAQKFLPKRVRVVSNGVPDPCVTFEHDVLPRHHARFAARQKLMDGGVLSTEEIKKSGGDPQFFRILYLAHCTREKGLFDAVASVRLAARRLAEAKSPITMQLVIAGDFIDDEEMTEFEALMAEPDVDTLVHYEGFVSGAQKARVLRTADLFLFPTFYSNENQPVNLIEAMAFGLPIITTRWRSLPEAFPKEYPGLVDVRAPEQIADAILRMMKIESGDTFRDLYLQNFTLEKHLGTLASAIRSVEQPAELPTPVPVKHYW